MNRRTVIRAVGLIPVSLTAGCFGAGSMLSEPGGSVRLRNEDETSHQLSLTIANDSGVEFERETELKSSESIEFTDAFGGGEYEVTVKVSGYSNETHQLTVGDCGGIILRITIMPDTIDISQGHCE